MVLNVDFFSKLEEEYKHNKVKDQDLAKNYDKDIKSCEDPLVLCELLTQSLNSGYEKFSQALFNHLRHIDIDHGEVQYYDFFRKIKHPNLGQEFKEYCRVNSIPDLKRELNNFSGTPAEDCFKRKEEFDRIFTKSCDLLDSETLESLSKKYPDFVDGNLLSYAYQVLHPDKGVRSDFFKKVEFIKESINKSEANDSVCDLMKSGLQTSLNPLRYQAVLRIMVNFGVINNEELPPLLRDYINDRNRFSDFFFDLQGGYFSKNVAEDEEKVSQLKEFNCRAQDFLLQHDRLEKLDHILRQEACARDLRRIFEKFPNMQFADQYEIETCLNGAYQKEACDQELLDYFNRIKKVIIVNRLVKRLGEGRREYLSEIVDKFIKGDEGAFSCLNETELSDKKVRSIFTKFVAFGNIENAQQFAQRLKGKVVSEFNSKFSDEVCFLGRVDKGKISSKETFFRGINLGNERPSAKKILDDLRSFHYGKSTISRVEQGLSSYRILPKRIGDMTISGSNRISYSTASSFDPIVALDYTTSAGSDKEYGVVYEIRPIIGRDAVKIKERNYYQVDFDGLRPEEVFAVHIVEVSLDRNQRGRIFKIDLLETVKNPHFKKRKGEVSESDFERIFPSVEAVDETDVTVTGTDTNEPRRRSLFITRTLGAVISANSAATIFQGDIPEVGLIRKIQRDRFSNFLADKKNLDSHIAEDASKDNLKVREPSQQELLKRQQSWNAYVAGCKEFNSDCFLWSRKEFSYSAHFKVYLSVCPEDLEKAAEILIKKGYFEYEKLPNAIQKIAFKLEKGGRLAIILYADENRFSDKKKEIWQERLCLIERDFYQAGIKPRPLTSQNTANQGARIVNDLKVEGGLYCYVKNDKIQDLVWSWDCEENPFKDVKINLASSIEEKITDLETKLGRSRELRDFHDEKLLECELKAQSLYLKAANLGAGDTYLITAENGSLSGYDEDIGMRKGSFITKQRCYFLEANKLTREIAQQKKAIHSKIATCNASILESGADIVVYAGNPILEMGIYGVSGLNKAICEDICSDKFIFEPSSHGSNEYFRKRVNYRILNDFVRQNSLKCEECFVSFPIFDKDKKPILENKQSRDKSGNLLYLGKEGQATTENTKSPFHKQKTKEVKVHSLKEGEVALLPLPNYTSSMGQKGTKFLIHAVGPDCRGIKSFDESQNKICSALKKAYVASFEQALKLNCKRIAVPVLSIGVYKMPEKEAAHVLVEVMLKYEDKFEKISVFAIDPKSPNTRPKVLDLIDEELKRLNRATSSDLILDGYGAEFNLTESDSGDVKTGTETTQETHSKKTKLSQEKASEESAQDFAEPEIDEETDSKGPETEESAPVLEKSETTQETHSKNPEVSPKTNFVEPEIAPKSDSKESENHQDQPQCNYVEVTNFEGSDKFSKDNLKVWHSKKVEVQNSGDKFDFSLSDEDKKIDEFDGLIKKALNSSKNFAQEKFKLEIEDSHIVTFVILAIKNSGFGNKDEVIGDIAKIFPDDNEKAHHFFYRVSRNFSGFFQQECDKFGIKTGNHEASRMVGMRLKRLYHGDLGRYLKYEQDAVNKVIETILGNLGQDKSCLKSRPNNSPHILGQSAKSLVYDGVLTQK